MTFRVVVDNPTHPPRAACSTQPMPRKVLRPGFHVLTRSTTEIQIGLHPQHAVILPSTDEVRRTLAALAIGTAETDGDPDVVAVLDRANLLIDLESAYLPPPPIQTVVFGPVPMRGQQPLNPRATLFVSVGEPDRTQTDHALRVGRPHHLVRFVDSDAIIGPLVIPGATPCLRCLDAHHTDEDPRWPTLVLANKVASSLPRQDGLPQAPEPELCALAVNWARNDLNLLLRGATPMSQGTTIRINGLTGALDVVRWLPHSQCGCGWSATMGA